MLEHLDDIRHERAKRNREAVTEIVLLTDPKHLHPELHEFRKLQMIGGQSEHVWDERKVRSAPEERFVLLVKWARAFRQAWLMGAYDAHRAKAKANAELDRIMHRMKTNPQRKPH